MVSKRLYLIRVYMGGIPRSSIELTRQDDGSNEYERSNNEGHGVDINSDRKILFP